MQMDVWYDALVGMLSEPSHRDVLRLEAGFTDDEEAVGSEQDENRGLGRRADHATSA